MIPEASLGNRPGSKPVISDTKLSYESVRSLTHSSWFPFVARASAEPAGRKPVPERAGSPAAFPGPDSRAYSRVADKDIENDKKQSDYTYIQREEEHKLDGNGQVKSSESKTSGNHGAVWRTGTNA